MGRIVVRRVLFHDTARPDRASARSAGPGARSAGGIGGCGSAGGRQYDDSVIDQGAPRVVPLRRRRSEWRPVAGLLAAYAAIRLLHLWFVQQGIGVESADPMAPAEPTTMLDRLGAWDGGWYVRIATDGYPDELTLLSVRDDSSAPLAFPPAYPMLMRVVGLLGMSPLVAGLLISAIAGLVAVVGVYAVARDLVSPRAAWFVAALWAAGPMTIVLSMAYSEALFVALAAFSLWLARRGWWLWAGVLAFLSGLTRSTGFAVGAALAVAAVLAIASARRRRVQGALSQTDPSDPTADDALRPDTAAPTWRPIVGAALGLVGVPAWWLYVAIVGGRLDAWFTVQEFFWGSKFDFGAAMLQDGWRMLTFSGRFDPMTRLVYSASFAAMAMAVALLVLLIRRAWREGKGSQWWPVAAYAAVLVVLAVGSDGFVASKLRFLVPMFPLLLVPAVWLARLDRPTRTASVVGLAIATGWFGAFMLVVWPYAI